MRARLPAVARAVVFLDAEGGQRHFRLRWRLDGGMRLVPQAAPPAGPRVCVLARSRVYRRRLQSRPAARRGLETLLRAAGEYFPAALRPANHCLYEDADGIYVCALPQSDAAAIAAEAGPLQALLVGPDAAQERDLLEAIEHRHHVGAAADLVAQPLRMVSGARIALAGAAAALVLAATASGLLLANQYPGQARLAREVAAAEAKAAPVAQRYESLVRMAAALRALGEVGRAPGANALATTTALLASAPAGAAVASIEYKNGELKVSGTGSNAADWLRAHGAAADAVSIVRLPQGDRFSGQVPLSAGAARGR